MRTIYLIACFLPLCLFVNSCKKGCTNPRAYNYNASAREEDASCQFCDSVVLSEFNESYGITDYNSSGPHLYETVLTINLEGNLFRYSGNACKLNGIKTNCGGFFDAFARIRPVLHNMTNDTIFVTGYFNLSVSGAGVNSTEQVSFYEARIPPQGEYRLDNDISFNCVQNTSAQASVINQSFYFDYR